MDDFKTLIGKVATGATLTREESANAFDRMMSGEATPSQMGGLLMALRRARRDGRRDHRRGHHDARQDADGGGAARRDRRGRHRRRCVGLLQHLDLRGLHRGGRRRAGRQARQPRAVLALRRRRRARRARREDRSAPGRDRALHPRGRHRLHVRAGASSGDEACRPDARRARHAHDLQPARPALQSGRREAPDGRRVLAPVGRAARASAQEPRLASAPGWCTAPTASTRSPPRARPRSRRSRTAR